MIKKMIATSAFLLSLLSVEAASTHLSVELKSGYKYDFLMEGKPVFAVNNGELVVKGSDATSFVVDGVKNFHFSEDKQPLNVVSDEIEMRVLSIDNRTIQLVNAPVSANVTILNDGGNVCKTDMTDSFGGCILSLPEKHGIYVLSIENQLLKFVVN